MTFKPAVDCRHFLGDRPCRFKQRCRCGHYSPMGKRILIIKLGALGDVVRTACLLPTLHREYQPCHVTWVSKPSGVRILTHHSMIDRLVTFDAEGILQIQQQPFDLVLSLDKEPAPAALCQAVSCPDKRGITLSQWGTPEPANAACGDYFNLGLDDELKFFANQSSYPELIHQALELPYLREPYRLYCDDATRDWARQRFAAWSGRDGDARPIIGLNTGSGNVFANKAPRPSRWVQIGKGLLEEGYAIALLGGPDEAAQNAWIQSQLGERVFLTGSDNTEQQFIAVVDQCDALISGDTLALHVAIARGVPVVALFGPTCEQEIDLFGLGRKILTPIECSPCYLRQCDKCPNCMDMILPMSIVAAVREIFQGREAGTVSET